MRNVCLFSPTALLALLALLASSACQRKQVIAAAANAPVIITADWRGTDLDGRTFIARFAPDSTLQVGDANGKMALPKMTYTLVEAPNSTYRLYLRIGGKPEPFALVRFDRKDLTLCMVEAYERTLNGISFGGISRTEWPRSADEPTCDVLHRMPGLRSSTPPLRGCRQSLVSETTSSVQRAALGATASSWTRSPSRRLPFFANSAR
jgi:hypothetical protein